MQFISGVKVVHAADKAERHRYRLLRQDDAKPWSKESAAMPSHHTTKDRSSFRVSGLAVSAVYSPLAFVSSMCMYSAQASQSRAAALSFGIRLLARPTQGSPPCGTPGCSPALRRQWQHSLCRPGIRQSGAGAERPLSRFFLSDTQKRSRSPRSGRDLFCLWGFTAADQALTKAAASSAQI